MNPFSRAELAADVEVTRLGLGSGTLGHLYGGISDREASDVLETAWSRGIRYFDTAPLYGHGLAERRLGTFLRRRRRDSFVISTKAGRVVDRRPGGDEAVFDYSASGVHRSLRESLERLGLESVDVVLIHDPDEAWEQAISEAYPALAELRSAGVVRVIGAGMNQWQMLERFVSEAELDCILVAGRYTLLDQSALTSLLPLCLERGTKVLIGGVYNSGLLADPRPGAPFNYQPAPPEVVERAERLRDACRRHSVPLKAAALQFAAAHPAVATVLVSARSRAELEENVEMAGMRITAELWTDLKVQGLIDAAAPVPA